MTPVWQRLAPRRLRPSGMLAAILSVLLLAGLFLPAQDPVTHNLAIEWRPSAELVGLLFLVAMATLARPQLAAGRGPAIALALIVTAAAVLKLADAAAPALLGRELNLASDLPLLSSIFDLAHEAAGIWSVFAATGLLVVAILLVIACAYWMWRNVLLTLADRRIAVGAAVLFGVALDVTAFAPAEERPLATALSAGIVRHAAALQSGWQLAAKAGNPLPAALAAPGPPESDLTGLKHRDVYLVYLESYGTTVFDTPEFGAMLRESLTQLEAALRGSGYTIASNRLVSPTFGGGSWLAHATLASGVRLDDPVLYSQLLGSGRKLLPGYFKDAGWRAVDITPGIKVPSAEARAWGFDREIDATELDYHGPAFGWSAIPDQFTLHRTAAIRASLGPELPVFTQIALVSSHVPFSPVPPYLADWGDTANFATVPVSAWEEVHRQSDWIALTSNYLKSLQYDFAVLGDWLTKYLPGNGLVILAGDHQPPAVVGGEMTEWTVPIHVLSRDQDLVAPFIAAGYANGFIPRRVPPYQGMEKFLPTFLAAFDHSG